MEKTAIHAADKYIQAALAPGRYRGCAYYLNTNIFYLPVGPCHNILLFILKKQSIALNYS